MKHVSILVPYGHASLPNIDGTHQILTETNNACVALGREPVFDIRLVGLSKQIPQRGGRFTIVPDSVITEIRKTDLVVIPAVHGDIQTGISENAPFIPWIKRHYEEGAEVASFCVAAFFLAETGLLDGRQCATHWTLASQFRQRYPQVQLVDERMMTHEDRIYTSGGAYSFLNLLLYIIERHAGRDVAIRIAKTFMIDIERASQSPFIMFEGQKDHDDEAVRKAQVYIESNFEDRMAVDALADRFAVGRRTFERRFRKATGNTVVEYIQRVKVEAAKRSFESSRKNISEVMYEVGYTDTKAFRDLFRKLTGLTPIEYRNKYNRQMAVA